MLFNARLDQVRDLCQGSILVALMTSNLGNSTLGFESPAIILDIISKTVFIINYYKSQG